MFSHLIFNCVLLLLLLLIASKSGPVTFQVEKDDYTEGTTEIEEGRSDAISNSRCWEVTQMSTVGV